MRNLKKLIALIAVLALTLSTVALGATYTDVAEDSAYSVAAESLSKLGIVTGYEDGTYGPDKAVTRAEMAALIARIQGYNESAKNNANTAFADVPYEFWASGYVAQASNQGIVNGYGDGTFGPDDAVKYEQAVTMIMRTLGYEPFAQTNGGYPTGYLAAAQRYGVTKNVSNAVSGTDANRGTIAQLLYNAIDTALMGQSKWGSNGDIEYEIYDGDTNPYRTLMSENLGVVKVKGLVAASSIATVDSGLSVDIDLEKDAKFQITILDNFGTSEYATFPENSTRAYLVGESDIEDALGYQVVAYFTEVEGSDNEWEVISYALDSNTNAKIEFTLDQYAGEIAGGEGIKYYKNATDNKPATAKFGKDEYGAYIDIPVLYNYDLDVASNVFGSVVTAGTDLGGKVTLIDNNDTNGYDLAIVEIGVTGIVDEVTSKKVAFKHAPGVTVSAKEETDTVIVITKDGEAIAVTDLAEDDVITLVANAADTIVYGEVVSTTVTGKIKQLKDSDTSATAYAYNIDGTFYDVDTYATSDCYALEIGLGGIYYVNKYGKIVAFAEDETSSDAGKYGYILSDGAEFSNFKGMTYQVEMLTADGIDVYDIATKFSTFGPNADYNLETDSGLNASGDEASVEAILSAGLVKYTTNAAGKINKIYFPDYDTDKFESKAVSGGAVAWDAEDFRFNTANGTVDEDAAAFIITADPDNSFVGTVADLDDKGTYDVVSFLTNRGDDADLLVVLSGYGATAETSNIAIITSVASAVNDAEEDVYEISYIQNGEEVEAVLTTADVYDNVSGLNEGDIVKIKLSSAGVISAIVKKVDFASKIRVADDDLLTGLEIAAGSTMEDFVFDHADLGVEYNKKRTAVTIGGDEYRLSKAKNIYVIDASLKSGKVDVGTVSDYEANADYVLSETAAAYYADWVFVRIYDGDIEDVVIVKNFVDVDDLDSSVLEVAFNDAIAAAALANIGTYTGTNAAKKTAALADIATAITAEEAIITAQEALKDAIENAADPAAEAAAIAAANAANSASYSDAADAIAGIDALIDAAETAIDTQEALKAAINAAYDVL